LINISQASNDVSLIGGPATVKLEVDFGPAGQRGSQIYTGPGNPTDPGIILPSIQTNDLFINLNPASIDYLYLWQYGSQDGIIAWRRILRLIPNTVLINPLIKFINGVAHTTVFSNNLYVDVKGIYFPLGGFGEVADLGNLGPKDFNIQHNLTSELPTASSINVREISDQFDVEYLYFNPLDPMDPLNGTYQVFSNFPFGTLALSASFTATEYDLETSTWQPVNGYRIVDIIATVGGKSTSVIDFDITAVNESLNLISLPSHGLSANSKVAYLSNISEDIGGLINQSEYFVIRIDEDTISLSEFPNGLAIDLSVGTASGTHSIGVLGVGF
jgi:hypothetical protein